MADCYVKIIKLGEPAKETVVPAGTTVGDALELVGTRNADTYHARYTNSTEVVPFSTPITGDTIIVLTKKADIVGGAAA